MSAARSPYTRSDFFLAFRLAPGVDNLFSMRDEKLHGKRKAQMQMGYTGKENIGLEASIDIQVKNFVDLVRRKYISTAGETRPMDLARKVRHLDATISLCELDGDNQLLAMNCLVLDSRILRYDLAAFSKTSSTNCWRNFQD